MSTQWPPAGTRPLQLDVVSVQSQVIYGCVGNNAALPVLQAMGLRTTAVPTVLLSNTPHYATLHGGATDPAWFAGFLSDLVARGAVQQLRAVLSGYLGTPAQGRELARWIGQLQQNQPAPMAFVDPVLGDHDHGVYVDPELIRVQREQLLPLATGLTPNSFELGLLADARSISGIAATAAAARSLLRGQVQWVVVTSAAPQDCPAGMLQLVVVLRQQAFLVRHPAIPIGPKGTGDLFSAALASRLLGGLDIIDAVPAACALVLQALLQTQAAQCAELLLPRLFDDLRHRDQVQVQPLE